MNSLIDKEARECLEKNSYKKKSFNLSANELLPMWIYVVVNGDVPNLLTECNILLDFRLKDHSLMSEADYNLTSLLNAVEDIKKDGGSGVSNSNKFISITPYIIQSNTTVPDSASDTMSVRSMSMSSVISKVTAPTTNTTTPKEDPTNLITNLTSTFKGLFK